MSAVLACSLRIGVPHSHRETNGSCQGPKVSLRGSKTLESIVCVESVESVDGWLESIVAGVVEVDATVAASDTVMKS